MEAFIYAADMLCEDCGRATIDNLTAAALRDFTLRNPDANLDHNDPEDVAIALGFDPEDEASYDSGNFPKGPYADGGGESDTPEHCSQCDRFLENPLTGEGYDYVIEAVGHADGDAAILAEWDAYYLGDCRERDLAFTPLTDGRTFRLQMFNLWATRNGKAQVGYIFGEPGKRALFVGFAFGVAPHMAISSDEAARNLLGFLTLRPGDTDAEWFENYTPAQMAWTKDYACEVLASEADENADTELIDFEPISAVERLAGPKAHYPYLIVRNGLELIDWTALQGDGRIRPTFNRDDWTAGDWTYAKDTQTLYVTGPGIPLWRAAHKMREDA